MNLKPVCFMNLQVKWELQVLRHMKEQVQLTIAGPVEDEAYWKECKTYITQLPSNISVHYTGPIANHEISGLIQQHHLFVLPTTGENFGHSIFEALMAGRPVLISDQTPWHNLQAKNAGWELSLNDPAVFATVFSLMANSSQTEFDLYAKGAWKFAEDFINRQENTGQYQRLFS